MGQSTSITFSTYICVFALCLEEQHHHFAMGLKHTDISKTQKAKHLNPSSFAFRISHFTLHSDFPIPNIKDPQTPKTHTRHQDNPGNNRHTPHYRCCGHPFCGTYGGAGAYCACALAKSCGLYVYFCGCPPLSLLLLPSCSSLVSSIVGNSDAKALFSRAGDRMPSDGA